MEDLVWDDDNTFASPSSYYSQIWLMKRPNGGFLRDDACVILVGDEYYASPADWSGRAHDVGPFETLEEAKAVAIVLWRTGAYVARQTDNE